MDAWEDTYTNNNVDTRNIMSSSDRICRDNFSRGQINQMWQIILFSGVRNFIVDLNVVDNFIDPDQYEPDDSDFNEVPRIIEVGETQFHSFHGFDECPDLVDWLRIDNSNGEIGSYIVEVNSVEGFTNAVDTVNIYNTDSDGNRAAKFSEITGGNGSIQIPCNTSTNDFLIEVVKAEDPEDEIVQSIYTISLSATLGVAISNAEQTELCNGDQFEILNLPANASVSWSSSFGTSIQTNNDQSITILSALNNVTQYWIRAVVNTNGCQKILTKTFVSANSGSFQGFEIVEVIPACSPANSVLEYGIYRTVPATDVNWSINSGSIFGAANGTSISVNPTFGNFTLTATQVNECGQDFSVSRNFFADECDCPFGLRFSNINDETVEMEIVSQSANFRNSGTHQVVVTDVNYRIQEQMETSSNICIINTSDYNDGTYFVHTYVDDCFEVGRIVVNKTDNCSNSCPCYVNINEAQLSRKTIQVEQKIISNSFNNADVTYIAGESILLETGFETHRYFDFEAKIEDCQ